MKLWLPAASLKGDPNGRAQECAADAALSRAAGGSSAQGRAPRTVAQEMGSVGADRAQVGTALSGRRRARLAGSILPTAAQSAGATVRELRAGGDGTAPATADADGDRRAAGAVALDGGTHLRASGLNRLSKLEPPPHYPALRTSEAGELLHLDVKKLGRIVKVGHRITGIGAICHGAGLGVRARGDRRCLACGLQPGAAG